MKKRKKKKTLLFIVGIFLIIAGIGILIPPPDIEFLLFPLFGLITGAGDIFRQVVTTWNPINWNYSILNDKIGVFVVTMGLVYLTGILLIILGCIFTKKSMKKEFNSIRKKLY